MATWKERARWVVKRSRRSLSRTLLAPWRRLRRLREVAGGIEIEIGPHLSPRVLDAVTRGSYETDEARLVVRHLRSDDVVVELGAGLGVISALCAREIGGDRVHAFEANPALADPIRRTYEINGVSPRLHICALGPERGEAPFYVERDLWASSMIRRSPNARKIRVPVEPVNEVVANLGATFLIVDIEGGESELLEAVDFTLLRALLIELHPDILGATRVDELRGLLARHGMVPRERGTDGRVVFYERDAAAPRRRLRSD